MSLSRILNDEPPPAVSNRSPASGTASMPAIDPALLSPGAQSAPRSPIRSHHGRPDTHGDPQSPPPRGHEYQPAAYQGTGGWDPYTGHWVQGEIFPLGRGSGNYYPNEQQGQISPTNSRNGHYREEDAEESSRKRRRGAEEEGEQKPAGGRRGRVSTPSRFMS